MLSNKWIAKNSCAFVVKRFSFFFPNKDEISSLLKKKKMFDDKWKIPNICLYFFDSLYSYHIFRIILYSRDDCFRKYLMNISFLDKVVLNWNVLGNNFFFLEYCIKDVSKVKNKCSYWFNLISNPSAWYSKKTVVVPINIIMFCILILWVKIISVLLSKYCSTINCRLLSSNKFYFSMKCHKIHTYIHRFNTTTAGA